MAPDSNRLRDEGSPAVTIHPKDYIFEFIRRSSEAADAERDYLAGGRDAVGWLKRMIELFRPIDGPFDLLEFAAGYGRVSRHMRSVLPSARVVASDIHPEAVEFLTELGLEAHLSSSRPESFALDRRFDVIFALSFFTHMPRATWGKWLRVLLERLKPRGCLIFTTHGVPGMKVMATGRSAPIEWDRSGFWFEPMSEQADIDYADYGSTGTAFSFVLDRIKESGGCLFHFQERGAGYQDVFIVRRPEDGDFIPSDSLPTAPASGPRRQAHRQATDPSDCIFYHSMDIPGLGEVRGQWDLRGSEEDCLGNVPLAGKSVLEIGPASGYLTFWMERQGADVTVFDLDHTEKWDLVPFYGLDYAAEHTSRQELIRKVNNAWWYTWRAVASQAACYYGSVYRADLSLGSFDVVTINSVLLHLRDPMLAIQRAAERTHDWLVITEVSEHQFAAGRSADACANALQFIPAANAGGPIDGWWYIPSGLVAEYMTILGFDSIKTHHFKAKFQDGNSWDLYTVAGRKKRATSVPQSSL